MTNSYRTTWTDWMITTSGVYSGEWSSRVTENKAGPGIKVYGYSGCNWNQFNESFKNWLNSSISQIENDHRSFSPGVFPAVPVLNSETVTTTLFPVGSPLQSANGVSQIEAEKHFKMDLAHEIKVVDSGECAYTGDFDPIADGYVLGPIKYELISSGFSYDTGSSFLAKTACLLSSPAYSPSNGFYPSADFDFMEIGFDGGWQHVLNKAIAVSVVSGKSEEITDSLEC